MNDEPQGPERLDLIANARIPSHRAQSVQVLHVAAAFAARVPRVRLLHARRHPQPRLPAGRELFEYYGVEDGPRPLVEALPCVDWIDRVPTRLQYLPARVQELSFARSAARAVTRGSGRAWVYSREVETALHLIRRGVPDVFVEVHRVPGGRLRRRWMRAVCQRATGLVAISGGVAEDLRALGAAPERVTVEHDGVALERFTDVPPMVQARAELGLAENAPTVVYAGSLLPWKGVDVLLGAARRLPATRFLVVGGSPEEVERLRGSVEVPANARLTGFRPPEEVRRYLAAADAAVVPNRSTPAISAKYTSPLKVFEAMATGTPVVASDLPSMRDIVEHGTSAWLVPPDDPDALARELSIVLADANLRIRLMTNARKVVARHSWSGRARRLVRWMAERSSAAGRDAA